MRYGKQRREYVFRDNEVQTHTGRDVSENRPAMHKLAGVREALAQRTIGRVAVPRQLISRCALRVYRSGRRSGISREDGQNRTICCGKNLTVDMGLDDEGLNRQRHQGEKENHHLPRRQAHRADMRAVSLHHPSAVAVPDHSSTQSCA